MNNKKKFRLTGRDREALSAWPAGQLREGHSIAGLYYGRLKKLSEHGYLVFRENEAVYDGQSFTPRTYNWTRTDKYVAPPTYKASKNKAWPWSQAQHWKVIKESPLHEMNVGHKKMIANTTDPKNRAELRRKIKAVDDKYPVFNSQANAIQCRKSAYEWITTGRTDMSKKTVADFFKHPQKVSLLFAMLLVTPVLDEEDNLVRFEPLAHEDQLDRVEEIRRATPTVYEDFIASGDFKRENTDRTVE